LGGVCEHRCGPMAERRGDRPLITWVDLERAEREPLATLGQRPRRGRKPLALVERATERRRAGLRDPRLLRELLADPLDARLPEPGEQLAGGLASQLQPLPPAPQPVQRGGGAFATPRDRRQLFLHPLSLAKKRLELPGQLLALLDHDATTRLRVLHPLPELAEV